MPFRKFFGSKINRLLLSAFILLAVPLLIINFVITSHSIQVTREEISHTYTNTLRLTAGQLSDRLKDLEMLASSLSIDDKLNAMCIMEKGTEDLYDYVQFLDRIRSYTNHRILQSNISVIMPRQGWIISTKDRIKRTESYDGFDEYRREIPGYKAWGIRRSLKDPESDCFSIVCGYVNEHQSNAVFVIEIEKKDVLANLARLGADDGISNVFLIDEDGDIYAEDQEGFQDAALREQVQTAFIANADASSETRHTKKGNPYLLLGERLPDSRCFIGIMIDEQAFLRPIVATRRWSYAAVASFMAALLIYMAISNRRITQPIDDMKDVMKKVEAGDFSARVYSNYQNEIGDVAVALNHMVERLDELIRERYISELQLTQTQIKFLRTQIRPHFLYNCLFTLYTLIKNEDLESAADMAIYLGQYYQINTRTDSGETPLYQEIESIRLLIKIQRMRFGDGLLYEEEIDDGLRMLPIPSLALLTIVENFLTHGLKGQHAPATVRIEAREEGEYAIISVADTGIGVTNAQLEEMQSRIDQAVIDQTNSHGLQNVMVRFSMMYGGTKMKVYMNEPHGLIVQVRIPKGA